MTYSLDIVAFSLIVLALIFHFLNKISDDQYYRDQIGTYYYQLNLLRERVEKLEQEKRNDPTR